MRYPDVSVLFSAFYNVFMIFFIVMYSKYKFAHFIFKNTIDIIFLEVFYLWMISWQLLLYLGSALMNGNDQKFDMYIYSLITDRN
jgi:hypothetical protein